MRTRHPAASSAAWFRASRATFASSFAAHHSARDRGKTEFAQRCQCQKHPCTKITLRRAGKTRSGRPGSPLTCTRYRYPRECASFRTTISGTVCFPLIADIFRRRAADTSSNVGRRGWKRRGISRMSSHPATDCSLSLFRGLSLTPDDADSRSSNVAAARRVVSFACATKRRNPSSCGRAPALPTAAS